MIIGFQRSAFSNEAGIGSAAIAHSAVRTRRPISEGFVALLEPFIDTVIVCTMTALTIIVANQASYRNDLGEGEIGGVALASDAFSTVASWYPILLAIAVASSRSPLSSHGRTTANGRGAICSDARKPRS